MDHMKAICFRALFNGKAASPLATAILEGPGALTPNFLLLLLLFLLLLPPLLFPSSLLAFLPSTHFLRLRSSQKARGPGLGGHGASGLEGPEGQEARKAGGQGGKEPGRQGTGGPGG